MELIPLWETVFFFFHLVTKISCLIRVNEGWWGVFPSCLFLKVSPVETEKGGSSWGWGGEGVKQLVPRARRDGGKSWHPLSPWV